MEKKQLEIANKKPVSSQPLCGVYAVALVSHKPVQRVFNRMKKTFNSSLADWRGGTYISEVLSTLSFYKRKFKKVKMEKKCTTTTFADYYAGKDKTYILHVGHHWFTIYNDTVYDQSGGSKIEHLKNRDKYTDRNKYGDEVTRYIPIGKRNQIVKDAWEITNSKMSKSAKLLAD